MWSTHQTIAQQLVTFVNDTLVVQDGGEIDTETPLLEMGLLDSLAMVSLLAFVHTRFGVHIPDEAVIPEHFETLSALAHVIMGLQTTTPVVPVEEQANSALLEAMRLLEASGVRRQSVALASGEAMHVLRVTGAEPTWVLLPGLGNPSSSWGALLRALADESAAIAVDFAGFGLSSCP
jgi:acyl carrier protein